VALSIKTDEADALARRLARLRRRRHDPVWRVFAPPLRSSMNSAGDSGAMSAIYSN
jgi:hypothetical protein